MPMPFFPSSLPIVRQQGVSLLVFAITILTIAGGAFFISLNKSADSDINTDIRTIQSLTQAKRALDNFFISYIPYGSAIEIARLPFPDRRNDPGVYDGKSDCINYSDTLSNNLLLGRFPWLRDECNGNFIDINANIKDGNGDRLWYAVSPHMVRHTSNANFSSQFLDANQYNQWITLYDQAGGIISNRVAFICLSPGISLSGQNRLNTGTDNFLDSYNVPGIGVINNFDMDMRFVKAPKSSSFNDQIIYMTIDELMPKAERRVLAEFKALIKKFHNDFTGYPYPALLGDSTFECDASTLPGGGYMALSNINTNCPSNPPLLSLATQPYLSAWLNYIIYEPRADCINTSMTTGCNNQPGGLNVNNLNNIDFVLLATGLHANTGSGNRANYLEDGVNQSNDQIFVTPDPTLSNDQILYQ
ncbi:hypothetical protein MNBD_GAMMA11-2775 [hydrothermal vent metagenome]|uniref:Uncharacterized protein n=1 Tax=hydrothermal vent metagenome TaxID=652676 RepID=A0A3B0X304_9ZZZZ